MRPDSHHPRGLRRSARARPDAPAPAPSPRRARAVAQPGRRAQGKRARPRTRSTCCQSLAPPKPTPEVTTAEPFQANSRAVRTLAFSHSQVNVLECPPDQPVEPPVSPSLTRMLTARSWPKATVTLGQQVAVASRDKSALEMK